jgi:hypothetical protein
MRDLRDEAVTTVDRRHGYTIEFSPWKSTHAAEYEREHARLIAEVAADPGLMFCQHEHRIHPLGGGQFVCFKCFASIITGRKL